MNETKELLDVIEMMIKETVPNLTTQIYIGVCKFVGTNSCTMLINGKTNMVKFYGDLPIVGKNYRVFVPNNDMSMAFIITGGETKEVVPQPPPPPPIQSYEQLNDKPKINNVILSGNLSSSQLSLFGTNNPPPYPVTSVDGKTGAVTTDSVKWTDVQKELASSETKVPSAKAVVDAITSSGNDNMLKSKYASKSDTIVNSAFQDGKGNEISTFYTPISTFNNLLNRFQTGVGIGPHVQSCHDITQSGFYYVYQTDPNKPPDLKVDYFVIAIVYSVSWMNLIGVDPRENKMWIKNKNNGVFGPWNGINHQILTQNAKPTNQLPGDYWYQII